MPIKFVNHLDNKTVQGGKKKKKTSRTSAQLPVVLTMTSTATAHHLPPSGAAAGTTPRSARRPRRAANMLGEIHEYQIKGFDFVMLMCCYSKLRFDVLLIVWHLLRKNCLLLPRSRISGAGLIGVFRRCRRRAEGSGHLSIFVCHTRRRDGLNHGGRPQTLARRPIECPSR